MAKFVIAGCGLAGAETALRLKKKVGKEADVIVVEKNQFFTHPDTYIDVFTRNPKELSVNLEFLFSEKGIQLVEKEIKDIDLDKGKLVLENGEMEYGYLCLSLGSDLKKFKGSYFTADSLDNIVELKEHITKKLSDAKDDEDLTITVVGGGPSGVELAAEINDFLDRKCADFGVRRIDVKLIIIEKKGTLLPSMPTKAGLYAAKYLSRMGVDVRTGVEAESATKSSLEVGGKNIPSGTVVWCGGTQPTGILEGHKIHTDAKNRVILNHQMQSVTDATIYAAGDAATFRNAEYKEPRTTTSSNISNHSKVVSHNLSTVVKGGDKKEFKYGKPSMWISLGEKNTLLLWNNVILKGRLINTLNRIRKWWVTRKFRP